MQKPMNTLFRTGVGMAFLLSGATVEAGSACWNEDRAALVWPEVIFRQSADLGDYRRTLAQSRDEVRQILEREYVSMVGELAPEFDNPESLLEPVLAAIMAFDAVHDRHKEQAAAGIPVYVEVGVRTALEQLYRSHRIAAEDRRLRFATTDLARRLDLAREALEQDLSMSEHRKTLRQVGAAVDMVAYATLAADGEKHTMTLSLENLHNGRICDFAAEGALEDVNGLLAESVFRGFQAVDFPEVENPNPHLTWIQPGTTEPIATAEQASYYCSTQGARLPYALELVTAAQAGAAQASYVAGGIPRLEPGLWAVADRQRNDGHHFYFEPLPGAVDSHPAGPVRTAAGLGPVRARYWCVQGDPDPRVTRIDDLYATHRQLGSSRVEGSATTAVEYLLNQENAFGARPRFSRAYRSTGVAWSRVREAGCAAGHPPTSDLLAANLPGTRPCPTLNPRRTAHRGDPTVN